MKKQIIILVCLLSLFSVCAEARMLYVGYGKKYKTIEDANKEVRRGDTILVFPNEHNEPYTQTAVYVTRDTVTFLAVPAAGETHIKVSGKGFNYSGVGAVPRAIFQFNKGADGCTVEGFELYDAHNDSHNGAGVRINQANDVRVRSCIIHNNDMGIMSNGDGTLETARNQLIEKSWIHHNGSEEEPGFNHNLYLGGVSVTLRFCEINNSLTGHNVKSRAHYTRVEYSFIHDSANREFDLVDGKETAFPESHAVLMGNVIRKNPACRGNKAVIHFGQDGGKQHDGTVYLVHNTIITPFISPVVDLSASKTKAQISGNIFWDSGAKQNNQVIVSVRNGAEMKNVTGHYNWMSSGFALPEGSALDQNHNYLKNTTPPPFVNPEKDDYHLKAQFRTGLPRKSLSIPSIPGDNRRKPTPPVFYQYLFRTDFEERPDESRLAVGAYTWLPVKKSRK